jgi:fatty-acyl-CoA synthase
VKPRPSAWPFSGDHELPHAESREVDGGRAEGAGVGDLEGAGGIAHVGAGAEGAPGSGEHHRAHVVVLVAATIGGGQRFAHRAREGIQPVGALQCERRHAILELEAQRFHRGGVAKLRRFAVRSGSVPNLAAVHEAIAAALPEHECLVFGERRLSWAAVTERTRRLAALFSAAGLGCQRPRAGLANHESGQDHVALYLYNGNEYLEGMLGAMKARCAPFNVNYRYVEEELLYLFDNAKASAVIFHAGFAPTLAKIRERVPKLRLFLEVEDGSGEHLEGAFAYEAALAPPPHARRGLSDDDLYILYTGGTTGMPKGVLWRQDDILRATLLPPRTEPTLPAIVERARRGAGKVRALPLPPFMHGAAHWAAFTMWHTGGTVIVPGKPRHLDPADVWSTVERERVTAMTIVGDAFA